MNALPPPVGGPLSSITDIWVEKPVVAPQSRWKTTALCAPWGDAAEATTLLAHGSAHPLTAMALATMQQNGATRTMPIIRIA